MDDSGPKSGGFIEHLRRLRRHTLSVLHNRIELFSVELQEEKFRQLELLLMAGAALLLCLLGAALVTAVIIFLFPPPYRIWVAAALGLIYLLIAALLLRLARSRLTTQPFSETIDQIKRDVECFTPRN